MATIFDEVLEPSGLPDVQALPKDAFYLCIQQGFLWSRVGPSAYDALIARASEMPLLQLRWRRPILPLHDYSSYDPSPSTPAVKQGKQSFTVALPDGTSADFRMPKHRACRKLLEYLAHCMGGSPDMCTLIPPSGDRMGPTATLEMHDIEEGDVLQLFWRP
jgi:hypothetical protein